MVFTIISVLFQAYYISSNKISFKDFDIRPTFSQTFIVDQTLQKAKYIIENIIPNTINSYKFKYDYGQNIFKANTGSTIRSWGEVIAIKLTQLDNTKLEISVLSKSILKTTIVDYGKNSMNIKKIKIAFDQNGL